MMLSLPRLPMTEADVRITGPSSAAVAASSASWLCAPILLVTGRILRTFLAMAALPGIPCDDGDPQAHDEEAERDVGEADDDGPVQEEAADVDHYTYTQPHEPTWADTHADSVARP